MDLNQGIKQTKELIQSLIFDSSWHRYYKR